MMEKFSIASALPKELGQKVLEEIASPAPNLPIMLEYMAAGADLEQRNEDGMTPLLLSTKRDLTDVSLALLFNGASVAVEDRNGDTPLMHAVAHKNIKVIRDLQLLNAPRRKMESSMSGEMWDRLMDSYSDKIAALEASNTAVYRPLKLRTDVGPKPENIGVFRPFTLKSS